MKCPFKYLFKKRRTRYFTYKYHKGEVTKVEMTLDELVKFVVNKM